MCEGFRVQDGWFALIRDLSQELEAAILRLPEVERSKYRAEQVKQKFGPLRFSMTQTTSEMDAVIEAAQDASARTCEMCGAPGVIRDRPRVRVLCDKCQAEFEASGAA
jgi:ribosomal protein L37AE/L43A